MTDHLQHQVVADLRARIAELERTIERQDCHHHGIEPESLGDDAILSDDDIRDIVTDAQKFRGDRAGRAMREIAEFEMVCSRSEYVAMANNLGRLSSKVAELESRLAGKTQFCAELEREHEETEMGLLDLCQRIVDHGTCVACMQVREQGLWRAPNPATPTDTQGGE